MRMLSSVIPRVIASTVTMLVLGVAAYRGTEWFPFVLKAGDWTIYAATGIFFAGAVALLTQAFLGGEDRAWRKRMAVTVTCTLVGFVALAFVPG